MPDELDTVATVDLYPDGSGNSGESYPSADKAPTSVAVGGHGVAEVDSLVGPSAITHPRIGDPAPVSRSTGREDGSAGGVGTVSRETSSTEPLGAHVSRETSSTGPLTNNVSRETSGSGPLSSHVSRETSLDTPIAREALQAVHVRNVRQESWPKPPERRLITVANQKGGVGKTTSAVNIAVALALHGLDVLLIDLDPQGNASTAMGVAHTAGTPSVYDVLLGNMTLAEVAVQVEAAPALKCVPATIDLAGADIELAAQVAREHRLRRAIAEYTDHVDYVIIDCPPTLGLLTLNALVAGKEILIPIQCEYYALEGLAQLLNTVQLVKTQLNATLEVSTVLLTMYDSRTRLADQVADEVRQHFGDKVIRSVIPRNVRVSEAPGYGQTVITYDAGSRGAISYLEAAHELAERGGAAAR